MTLLLTGSLNRLDVYRIVSDFDQVNFKTAEELPKDQADRIFVIIQVERKLYADLPVIELIDQIMRLYLENCPSVVTLLMLYNTPAIVVLHPLPFSYGPHHISTASKSFLVRLEQTPADGKLASYQQLMTSVFTHHFQKLTFDQKLELIRRSNITPWEQKSANQKLELLGRIQAPILWGQAKVRLQFLLWKVQFAAVWALENQAITKIIKGPAYGLFLCGILLSFAEAFFPKKQIVDELMNKLAKACVYFTIAVFAVWGASLASTGLVGFALQIPIFPKSLQEKGAWILSVSESLLLIALHVFKPAYASDRMKKRMDKQLHKALQELHKRLLEPINQNTFIEAHLPDLINQWLQLTDPSDTNTGSLQMLQ